MISRKDIVGFACFLCVWILPSAYRGLRHGPFTSDTPPLINFLYDNFRLFDRTVSFWPTYYIQVLPSAQEGWVTVPTEQYFAMQPFGYRTRLTMFFHLGFNRVPGLAEDLLSWIHARYVALNPAQRPPIGVRIIVGRSWVGEHPPPSHWQNPPLTTFQPDDLLVILARAFPVEQSPTSPPRASAVDKP